MHPAIRTNTASRRFILPLGSSRWAVRGFRKSISRSIIRFNAKAIVRAPTAAVKTKTNNSTDGV